MQSLDIIKFFNALTKYQQNLKQKVLTSLTHKEENNNNLLMLNITLNTNILGKLWVLSMQIKVLFIFMQIFIFYALSFSHCHRFTQSSIIFSLSTQNFALGFYSVIYICVCVCDNHKNNTKHWQNNMPMVFQSLAAI